MELPPAIRESLLDAWSVFPNREVIRLRGEEECSRRDLHGQPAHAPGSAHRVLLVPPELPLETTHVIEPGLDFDHEECACCRMEGQEIDPPRSSGITDLDLACNEPTGSLQTSGDERDAPRMGEVSLTIPARDDRYFASEDERCADGPAKRIGIADGQRQDPRSLDPGHPALRSSDAPAQVCLCDPEAPPDLTEREAEGDEALLGNHACVIAERA